MPVHQRRSFTLIELIIVVAIIAIIVSAVFVAIDPVKRLADARKSRALSDAEQIDKAIQLFLTDNATGSPIASPSTYFAEHPTPATGNAPICPEGTATSTSSCVSLQPLVAAGYLPKVPKVQNAVVDSGFLYAFSNTQGAYAGAVSPDPVLIAVSSSSAASSSSSSSSSTPPPPSYALSFTPGQYLTGTTLQSQPDAFDFAVNAKFSYSLWVKPHASTPPTATYAMLGNYSTVPSVRGYYFYLQRLQPLFFFLDAPNSSYIGFTGSTITPGAWSHLAFTYDGTIATPSARGKMYINGALGSNQSNALGTIADVRSPAPLLIARTLNVPFHGELDEVRVYNEVLSAPDVAALANISPGDDRTANLITRWAFNEGGVTGTGTITNDGVGTNHRTFRGAPAWVTGAVPY